MNVLLHLGIIPIPESMDSMLHMHIVEVLALDPVRVNVEIVILLADHLWHPLAMTISISEVSSGCSGPHLIGHQVMLNGHICWSSVLCLVHLTVTLLISKIVVGLE